MYLGWDIGYNTYVLGYYSKNRELFNKNNYKKKIILAISPEILEHLKKLPYDEFESDSSRNLIEKISQDPAGLILNCFSRTMTSFFSLVSIFSSIFVLLVYSVWIGIGALIIVIPMTVLTYYSNVINNNVWNSNSSIRRHEENLRNLTINKHALYEMKVFESTDYIENKWHNYYCQIYTETRKGILKSEIMAIIGKMFSILYIIFMGIISIRKFINGTFTLGSMSALMTSMIDIITKLNKSSIFVSDMFKYSMRVDCILEFFKIPERKLRKGDFKDNINIKFSHVIFKYPNTNENVLYDINIDIKQGENIAFVGENGSGKTTLIKLLCGLYPVTSGEILIGDRNLDLMSDEAKRKLISVVFQDFQSYWISIRENVGIGNIKKLWEDNAIIAALHLANAEDLISQNHWNIDTNLGKFSDNGVDLSKGQWQRLAMARAFISDAKYIVLDEPTASIDPIAECEMYEYFSKIFKNKGTIMISHRLASAKMADKIFVLSHGQIVEEGNHESLMKKRGLYYRMFIKQSLWYKEDAKI